MRPFNGYITCVHLQFFFEQVINLISHSSHDSQGSSLIPNIRKLFLLDISSRSTNFLQISNAHVGSVVCIQQRPLLLSLVLFPDSVSFHLCLETSVLFRFG